MYVLVFVCVYVYVNLGAVMFIYRFNIQMNFTHYVNKSMFV